MSQEVVRREHLVPDHQRRPGPGVLPVRDRLSAQIVTDRETGRSRGFAFVEMATGPTRRSRHERRATRRPDPDRERGQAPRRPAAGGGGGGYGGGGGGGGGYGGGGGGGYGGGGGGGYAGGTDRNRYEAPRPLLMRPDHETSARARPRRVSGLSCFPASARLRSLASCRLTWRLCHAQAPRLLAAVAGRSSGSPCTRRDKPPPNRSNSPSRR